MPKVDICAFDQKCVQKFQHYIKQQCLPFHQKQRNKPCFKSLVFFFNNIFPVLHLLNMLVIILFCLCPHELVKIWNFNTFLHKCNSIQDYTFFFAIAFDSHFSISIALHCASAIICTSMDYYTSICTSMNGCTSASTTLSSPTSIYIVCASTKCYSTPSSSSNSSMNTGSTNVTFGLICSLACQLLLLWHKNSNIDVLILYIS